MFFKLFQRPTSRCSIVVSIPTCHAGDSGLIPSNGVNLIFAILFYFFFCLVIDTLKNVVTNKNNLFEGCGDFFIFIFETFKFRVRGWCPYPKE